MKADNPDELLVHSYDTGAQFFVGFVDPDHMKQINDTFGHQEGNRALMETDASHDSG